jgi:hypothetical protein
MKQGTEDLHVRDREISPGGIRRLGESFELSLEAANKSPRTIRASREAVRLLAAFLEANGMPTGVASITREHVEHFMVAELARTKRPRPQSATGRSSSSSSGPRPRARSSTPPWSR